jgi:hypothetical protein
MHSCGFKDSYIRWSSAEKRVLLRECSGAATMPFFDLSAWSRR